MKKVIYVIPKPLSEHITKIFRSLVTEKAKTNLSHGNGIFRKVFIFDFLDNLSIKHSSRFVEAYFRDSITTKLIKILRLKSKLIKMIKIVETYVRI